MLAVWAAVCTAPLFFAQAVVVPLAWLQRSALTSAARRRSTLQTPQTHNMLLARDTADMWLM
jgi:hypothetical protein